jgi:2-oxoglutarate ferredoxin oxidoreductase subunit beta
MTPCPTTYGRRNKEGDAVAMTHDLKVRSASAVRILKMSDEEKERAIPTGVFVDTEKPEYTEQYAGLVARLQGDGQG